MYKFFARPALLLLAVGQLLVSCSKESDKNAPQPQKPLSQNATAYDYLGQQHNDGLDFILQNADPKNARSQVSDLTAKFCITQGYEEAEVKKGINSPQVQQAINSSDPGSDLRKYYASNGMTTELDYANKISDALSHAANSQEAAINLGEIEEQVSSDKNLSADSQVTLLKALAIGRYSAKYWYAQSKLDADSPWVKQLGSPLGTGTNAKPWWAIALADVFGGMMGAGGGPVGVILGAIGGSGTYALP